jgi:hypothetical protein
MPREAEHRVAAQRDHQQVDDVERGDDVEDAEQRKRDEVLEDRVVVQREVRRARQREDLAGEERQLMPVDELVPEDPLVPALLPAFYLMTPRRTA